MLRFIALALAVSLSACVTNQDEKYPKFIGWGLHSCATGFDKCGLPSNDTTRAAWVFHRDSTGLVPRPPPKDTFYVYVTFAVLNAGGMGSRTRGAIQSMKTRIYDVGGNCMTFEQTGKDTIMIDRKQVIVSVPIEPCVPYTLR